MRFEPQIPWSGRLLLAILRLQTNHNSHNCSSNNNSIRISRPLPFTFKLTEKGASNLAQHKRDRWWGHQKMGEKKVWQQKKRLGDRGNHWTWIWPVNILKGRPALQCNPLYKATVFVHRKLVWIAQYSSIFNICIEYNWPYIGINNGPQKLWMHSTGYPNRSRTWVGLTYCFGWWSYLLSQPMSETCWDTLYCNVFPAYQEWLTTHFQVNDLFYSVPWE